VSQPDEAVALLRAILADQCGTELAARHYLIDAQRLGVDPLDYCAHRFGLGNEPVWRRAAHWAGLCFAAETPCRLPLPEIARLEHLADVRSFRQHVLGEELLFIAPNFQQLLSLRSAGEAVKARLRCVPPNAIEAGLARAASGQLIDAARQRITQLWPEASAAQDLTLGVRIGFVATFALLIVIAMVAGLVARPLLVPAVASLLMAPGLLRLLAALRGSPPPSVELLGDVELPIYTVLIPLRDEAPMVPMLARAMRALDYPAEKLDVKFVVEQRSEATVLAVRQVLADPMFRMVLVPDGPPRTKPKAIDYALPLARGACLVVYDAEDVPDPGQLRLAASRFAADPRVACLQAELVPENASENALTALFAGEYAGLFGRLLPALARWRLPVPLGGTSNHFRTEILREIGGWDAFNVTEDADLGVRLARRGLRAEMIASRTLEEAPLTMRAWMAQRTRWMKGWMQTFIVHNRAPRQFLREAGWRGFLGFQVLVGGMILASLLHTLFVASLLLRLGMEGVVGLVPRDIWDWAAVAILASGYGGAFAIQVSGLIHQRAYHLLPIQIVLPFYWLLHTIAAVRAAVELIRRPIYWAKTTHGVTRLSRGGQALGSAVAAEVEVGGVDVRLPARHQIGDELARRRRHGPAERAMAGVEVEITIAGAADHRRTVGRHRA
jgi:cellulose synthase/poly-beta-1,6-N-acetylglucosamine synthase-like glycosyltransferase